MMARSRSALSTIVFYAKVLASDQFLHYKLVRNWIDAKSEMEKY